MKTLLITTPLILLAVLLMSFNHGGGGGDKCKFDYEKADKFSGKMIRYDNYSMGIGTIKVQIGDNAGQFYISVGTTVQGENLNSMSTTDTLFMKLADNSIVFAIPSDVVKPTAYVSGAQVVTFYGPIYNISRVTEEHLSKSEIVAFKYSISGKPFSIDCPDGKAKKFMHTFSCLLK